MDADLKREFDKVCNDLGLTMKSASRLKSPWIPSTANPTLQRWITASNS